MFIATADRDRMLERAPSLYYVKRRKSERLDRKQGSPRDLGASADPSGSADSCGILSDPFGNSNARTLVHG
jgi:hypothetical protein